MNLPVDVADPSLLQHEPLRSHVPMYGEAGSRSGDTSVLSSFVKAMQEDSQVRVRNVSLGSRVSTTHS